MALIGGHISLEAVIKADVRVVNHIYFDKKRYDTVWRSGYHFPEKKQYERFTAYAESKGVEISYLTDEEFSELTGGEAYGGIAADVGERTYSTFKDVADSAPNGYFVMLDGIEDPFNFGYVLRTLYTAGVDGVFLPTRNFLSAVSTVIRSSAGTSELLNIALYDDDEELLGYLKKKGIYIVAASKTKDAANLFSTRFKRPLCLIIGGEKRGIHKNIAPYIDKTVSIVYPRDTGISLSASSAAAILSYEVANKLETASKRR